MDIARRGSVTRGSDREVDGPDGLYEQHEKQENARAFQVTITSTEMIQLSADISGYYSCKKGKSSPACGTTFQSVHVIINVLVSDAEGAHQPNRSLKN